MMKLTNVFNADWQAFSTTPVQFSTAHIQCARHQVDHIRWVPIGWFGIVIATILKHHGQPKYCLVIWIFKVPIGNVWRSGTQTA